MLCPLQTAERLVLVTIEAVTCGTPVAAIRVGAVWEIVDEGVTGCCAESVESFDVAVLKAMPLDRRGVRDRAVQTLLRCPAGGGIPGRV